MKKYFLLIVMCIASLHAEENMDLKKSKGLTVCMSYLIAANEQMDCSGDYNGKASLVELYKNGWKVDSSVSGASKFIFVISKK